MSRIIHNNVASGGSSGSGDALTADYAQATHGFVVGNSVRWTGGAHTKAQADSTTNAEGCGIVSAVADTNNFTLTFQGIMPWASHGKTTDTTYWLDPSTAGAATATEPTTIGQVRKALYNVIDANTIEVLDYPGMEITATSGGVSYIEEIIAADTNQVDFDVSGDDVDEEYLLICRHNGARVTTGQNILIICNSDTTAANYRSCVRAGTNYATPAIYDVSSATTLDVYAKIHICRSPSGYFSWISHFVAGIGSASAVITGHYVGTKKDATIARINTISVRSATGNNITQGSLFRLFKVRSM